MSGQCCGREPRAPILARAQEFFFGSAHAKASVFPQAKKLAIALAGNSNVGKSALFNSLVGSSQHVANWPGKTVEVARGKVLYRGYEVEVVDLPGSYSSLPHSAEEEITRDFISAKSRGVLVNVVDVCALERNLFFSLELAQSSLPVVMALNQCDLEQGRGLQTDAEKLGRLLCMRVVRTVATSGRGLRALLDACIEAAQKRENSGAGASAIKAGKKQKRRFPISEKYRMAEKIAAAVQKKTAAKPSTLSDRLERLTMHGVYGYAIMLSVLFLVFYSIFAFGGSLSLSISEALNGFRPAPGDGAASLLFEAVFGGFVAGITLVLPYALPFYLLLSLLEDTGYITRIAFLLDGLLHRMGLHGKAIIPLILGYGCNVPAIFASRIMENRRDRLITAFATTLVPCTARTVVVFGLVGAFLGPWWALGLYLFNAVVIALVSRLAYSLLPGEQPSLIMEMPPYRMPQAKVVLRHTYYKLKSIISIVFPYYIVGGFAFSLFYLSGLFEPLNGLLAPLTSGWLGLPAISATLLVFGLVRKELVVVLPAVLFSSQSLAALFSPLQMVVLTIVALFYAPCLATLEALRREFGAATAAAIALFEVAFAIVLGGLAFRALAPFF